MRWHLHTNLFLGALILLACASSDAQDAKKDKQDDKKPAAYPVYYPLEKGNTWYYKVTANGQDAKITTRIAKHEDINKQMLARLESPSVAMTEHLLQNDKGVFRVRFNGLEVTPPFRLIPYPAKVGTKWQGEFSVEKDKGTHKYTGEIQKEEDIEVPAGKYKKTLRVYIELEEGDKKVRTTYWFAQDVGFVKQTFESAGISVLLELEKMERKN